MGFCPAKTWVMCCTFKQFWPWDASPALVQCPHGNVLGDVIALALFGVWWDPCLTGRVFPDKRVGSGERGVAPPSYFSFSKMEALKRGFPSKTILQVNYLK